MTLLTLGGQSLSGGGGPPLPTDPSDELNSPALMFFLPMEEGAGKRYDYKNHNDFYDYIGPTGHATGLVGWAGEFIDSFPNTLKLDATPALALMASPFTVWASVYFYNFGAIAVKSILSKLETATTSAFDLRVTQVGVDYKLSFALFGSSGTPAVVTANSLGPLSPDTWYTVFAWYDPGANSINIQVNDGPVDTLTGATTIAGAMSDVTAPFLLGSGVNGLIDQVGLTASVLSPSARTFYYNGGDPVPFPFEPPYWAELVNSDLEFFLKADELSGTRADSSGKGNHFLAVSPTGFTTGIIGNAIGINGPGGNLQRSGAAALASDPFTLWCSIYLFSITSGASPFISRIGAAGQSAFSLNTSVVGVNAIDLSFTIYGTTGSLTVSATSANPLTLNTWYTIYAWYDDVADTISIQVNNGPVDTQTGVVAAVGPTRNDAASPYLISTSASIGIGIDEIGLIRAVLSPEARTYYYGGGAILEFPFLPYWKELDNLLMIFFAPMDEVSGTRYDVKWGTNNFLDTSSTGSTTGVIGLAGDFVKANSNYLEMPNIPPQDVIATGGFTVWATVQLKDKSATQPILHKFAGSGVFVLYYVTAPQDKFYFAIYTDSDSKEVYATSLGSPALNTWYTIFAWHDFLKDTINIQVNNGPVNSVSGVVAIGTPIETGTKYTIGARVGLFYSDIRVEQVGVTRLTPLTAGARAYYYNGGLLRPWPFVT